MKSYRRQYERLFGKGWSGGWRQYRYGEAAKKPVSLPPIFSKGKRDHVAEQISEILRSWTSNRWEGEAAARHGIRAALVLQGYGWARSDAQAAEVVRAAFIRLGRGKERRLTPDQAAPEYLIPRENCAVCYRPLDDQQIAMGLRYCGPEHARFAWQKRAYADGWHNSELGTAAYRMVYRERFKDRTCANPKCRHPRFQPASEDQKFCTPACLYESQAVEYLSRVCDLPSCGKVFTPTSRYPDQRYCCHKHALDAKKTREAQECARPGCGKWFVSSHNNATEGGRRGLYCSRECADAMRGEVRHELACQCCSDPFTAAMPNAVACCNAHYQILRKFEKGLPPKRLSAPVFDYLFFRDQPQQDHQIQQIFDSAA